MRTCLSAPGTSLVYAELDTKYKKEEQSIDPIRQTQPGSQDWENQTPSAAAAKNKIKRPPLTLISARKEKKPSDQVRRRKQKPGRRRLKRNQPSRRQLGIVPRLLSLFFFFFSSVQCSALSLFALSSHTKQIHTHTHLSLLSHTLSRLAHPPGASGASRACQ